MAMLLSWIPLSANLRNHPKAIHLAALLGDHRAHTYLPDLWSWASQNQPDGRITGSAPAMVIEAICGWRGEPGKLTESMLKSRWLDRIEDGYAIHDWNEHCEAHSKLYAREVSRERKAKARAASRYEGKPCPALTGTDAGQTRPLSHGNGDMSHEKWDTSPSPSPSSSSSLKEEVQEEKTQPVAIPLAAVQATPPKSPSALVEGLGVEFKRHRGVAYSWRSQDESALRGVVGVHPDAEILRRWGIGLRTLGYPRCDTVCDLVKHWNAYAAEKGSPGKGPPPPERRMLGGKPLSPAELRALDEAAKARGAS